MLGQVANTTSWDHVAGLAKCIMQLEHTGFEQHRLIRHGKESLWHTTQCCAWCAVEDVAAVVSYAESDTTADGARTGNMGSSVADGVSSLVGVGWDVCTGRHAQVRKLFRHAMHHRASLERRGTCSAIESCVIGSTTLLASYVDEVRAAVWSPLYGGVVVVSPVGGAVSNDGDTTSSLVDSGLID